MSAPFLTNPVSEKTIDDAFNRIRESEELGRGSCSTIDECYEDNELHQLIVEELMENPDATSEDVFNSILEMERIRNSYESDIQNA